MYERGLQALQRHDFAAAAECACGRHRAVSRRARAARAGEAVSEVCERELEPGEPAPKTADEWVYAATVALNAGDEASALAASAARASGKTRVTTTRTT